MLIYLQSNYVDSDGLVRPNTTDLDSDNGVLFTSVAQILSHTNFLQPAIDKCYEAPGLLARKPASNPSSQEQFDDVMGRAISGIVLGNTKECREILWYGITHFGFYNTDNNLQGKDFLFRFVFTFLYVFCAAFPKLKWLVYPFLLLYVQFMNPSDLTQTSPLQLQWLSALGNEFLYGVGCYDSWYNRYKKNTGAKLSAIFSGYYNAEHPFTLFVQSNLD